MIRVTLAAAIGMSMLTPAHADYRQSCRLWAQALAYGTGDARIAHMLDFNCRRARLDRPVITI
jgi:hypothetical protein